MQCPRCLNEDSRYFYQGSKGLYCRKCVTFKRILLDDNEITYYQDKALDCDYQLSFTLTAQQTAISDQLADMVDGNDVLVYAACGAGKTEIVMKSIKKYLNNGKKAGFATPRRQVVIEVGKRLSQAFKQIDVTWVCEGYTSKTDGDLIVCTTHQLYRYHQYFDLLILDEPDAFPYRGNSTLAGIVKTSCHGHLIYLTATPDVSLIRLPTLTLFKRPHGHDLIVPKVIYCLVGLDYLFLLRWLHSRKRVLVFVPTIALSIKLAKLLCVPAFNSLTKEKDMIIEAFKSDQWKYLVCTTILERGITISNVNVCVFHAEHSVFDTASLIQIMGRIGRDPNHPYGDGLMICQRREKKIDECLKTIQMMNV